MNYWTYEGYKAMALYDLGRTGEAEEILATIAAKVNELIGTEYEAEAYLLVVIPAGWMGKNDLAFDFLFAELM